MRTQCTDEGTGGIIFVGNSGATPPDRLRPCSIMREAAQHMDMQLPHLVADSPDIELFRPYHLLQGMAGCGDFLHQHGAVRGIEIHQLDQIRLLRHQHQPREAGIVQQQDAREAKPDNGQGILVQLRVEGEGGGHTLCSRITDGIAVLSMVAAWGMPRKALSYAPARP